MLEPRAIRRSLGAYQLLSGVIGLIAILDYAPRASELLPDSSQASGLALWIAASAPLLLLAVAGGLLLSEKRAGAGLTWVVQLAQVAMVSTPMASYVFSGGFFGGLLFQNGAVRPIAGWSVQVALSWSSDARFFGFNLVPLVVIAVLWYSARPHSGEAPQ